MRSPKQKGRGSFKRTKRALNIFRYRTGEAASITQKISDFSKTRLSFGVKTQIEANNYSGIFEFYQWTFLISEISTSRHLSDKTSGHLTFRSCRLKHQGNDVFRGLRKVSGHQPDASVDCVRAVQHPALLPGWKDRRK